MCDGSVYCTEEKNLERTAQRLSCPVRLVCFALQNADSRVVQRAVTAHTAASPSISLKTIIVSPLDSGIPPIIVFFLFCLICKSQSIGSVLTSSNY